MRVRLFLCLVAAAVVAGPAVPAGSRVDAGNGLSIVLPQGWRLSHARVTICDGPEQVLLAVRGRVRLRTSLRVPPRVALVLLMEGGGSGFPARPRHFALPPLGNLGGCCEMPVGRGAELVFRDQGRRFYAFVYVGVKSARGSKASVLALLDSLWVSRR